MNNILSFDVCELLAGVKLSGLIFGGCVLTGIGILYGLGVSLKGKYYGGYLENPTHSTTHSTTEHNKVLAVPTDTNSYSNKVVIKDEHGRYCVSPQYFDAVPDIAVLLEQLKDKGGCAYPRILVIGQKLTYLNPVRTNYGQIDGEIVPNDHMFSGVYTRNHPLWFYWYFLR